MNSITGWAQITDVHFGFQRTDGRNLMGFYDGISNPDRMNNKNVWLDGDYVSGKFRDGTFYGVSKNRT